MSRRLPRPPSKDMETQINEMEQRMVARVDRELSQVSERLTSIEALVQRTDNTLHREGNGKSLVGRVDRVEEKQRDAADRLIALASSHTHLESLISTKAGQTGQAVMDMRTTINEMRNAMVKREAAAHEMKDRVQALAENVVGLRKEMYATSDRREAALVTLQDKVETVQGSMDAFAQTVNTAVKSVRLAGGSLKRKLGWIAVMAMFGGGSFMTGGKVLPVITEDGNPRQLSPPIVLTKESLTEEFFTALTERQKVAQEAVQAPSAPQPRERAVSGRKPKPKHSSGMVTAKGNVLHAIQRFSNFADHLVPRGLYDERRP